MLKRLFGAAVAVFLLLCLSGCGGKADMAFTTILPQEVSSLDPQTASGPASSIVIGSIYEGLCRLGEDSQILPGVATRWDHNDECTEFTFHLRKAAWSNGEQVTAEDFVFGVLRALNPETKASGLEDLFLIKNARAFHTGAAEEADVGIRAENDRTLVIELETGFPDFPALTAGSHYMPCNRAFFEESAGHYGLSAEYILTNGPFTFPHIYAWNTDYGEQSISLERSNSYRGEHKTVPAALTYLIDYDDAIDSDPVAALKNGDVDILQLSEAQARQAEEQGCPVLALEDGVTGLLLNPQSDALSYVGARELFLKSLDRENLLASDGWSAREEAVGIMPGCVLWDGEPYYASGGTSFISQDDGVIDTIPSLLGLLDWEQIPSITVLCPDDDASIALANNFLVSWNSKLGNAFNILPLPESDLDDQVGWGEYEAALYTLRAGGITPYNVLTAFSSSASPLLLKSDEYDGALEGLSFTLEGFQALEGTLRDDCVFYPLFSAKTYYALAPGVTGVSVPPDQRLDFSRARKKG